MKKTLRHILTAVAVCAATAAIFIFPSQIRDGVAQGLTLCAEVIIPSMFVFAVVAAFAAESGAAHAVSKPLSYIFSPIFKIPRAASCAILLSFICGYPIGAAGVSRLYKNGEIDLTTAKRMLAICVNASPTLVIVAIGDGLLGDMTVGWIIYLSHIAASVIIGAVWSIFSKKPHKSKQTSTSAPSIADAFVNATSSACSQMLIICGYVVLFCAVGEICGILAPWVATVLEVTSGAKWAVSAGLSVPMIAGIVGFGGVSVICQVLSVARGIIEPSVLIFTRVANGILSFALCTAVMKVMRGSIEVLSNLGSTAAELAVVTVPSSIAMLIMAATFLLTVRRKN